MEKILKECICWKQCMIGMDGERQSVRELYAQKPAQKLWDKPTNSLFTSTPWRELWTGQSLKISSVFQREHHPAYPGIKQGVQAPDSFFVMSDD